VLESGDEGPAVADLQSKLARLAVLGRTGDSVYGWLTEQAVYAFQKANENTVDGRVGPKTSARFPTTPRVCSAS